jgi:hypothetical protein
VRHPSLLYQSRIPSLLVPARRTGLQPISRSQFGDSLFRSSATARRQTHPDPGTELSLLADPGPI